MNTESIKTDTNIIQAFHIYMPIHCITFSFCLDNRFVQTFVEHAWKYFGSVNQSRKFRICEKRITIWHLVYVNTDLF